MMNTGSGFYIPCILGFIRNITLRRMVVVISDKTLDLHSKDIITTTAWKKGVKGCLPRALFLNSRLWTSGKKC